jgi:hypothetical protein
MSAATTIAPALNPLRAPAPRAPSPQAEPIPAPVEPAATEEVERGSISGPQHMQALARANEVRLARAALKRQVAAGTRVARDIVLEVPWEAESMSVSELLSAQRRWGRQRSRKLIVAAGLTETKRLGTMTERQRGILARALDAKAAATA